MIKLDNSIKILVPQTDNDGNALNFTPEIKAITGIVGGATVYQAKGLWEHDNRLYTDSVSAVEFNYSDKLNTQAIVSITTLITREFTYGKQEAVSVYLDKTLYILESLVDVNDLKGLLK